MNNRVHYTIKQKLEKYLSDESVFLNIPIDVNGSSRTFKDCINGLLELVNLIIESEQSSSQEDKLTRSEYIELYKDIYAMWGVIGFYVEY